MGTPKFRAWDSEFKSYVEPVTYFVGFDGSAWFNNCGDGEDAMYDQSEKLTVEQFTGLKDCNGKEIFEGDIIRVGHFALNDTEKFGKECWNKLPDGIKEGDITTEIERRVVTLGIKALYILERAIINNPDVIGVEIIGNIHKNPEILG